MKKTVLLFGGNSDERLVSTASAQNIASRLEFSELWFLTTSGGVCKVSSQELFQHQKAFENEFQPKAPPVFKSLEVAIADLKDKTVYMGLHGTEGEDGQIQSLFEKHKVCFTGSGSKASRDSFLKDVAKKIVGQAGVTLAPEISVRKNEADAIRGFQKTHGKIVIKPLASGSSFGLHIVKKNEELEPAIAAIAKEKYDSYLVEKFIEGRELTVGVFDSAKGLQALPPSEVVLETGHSFDYKGKYLGRGTTEITPAKLSSQEIEQAQQMALRSHQALGCYGYTRTDMILTNQGPVYLETNTLPGMSKASFVPQQLAAANEDMKTFVENQLRLAEKRYL